MLFLTKRHLKTNSFNEVEFFYLRFFYNKNVLVPRLETESLVREAIKIIKQNNIDVLIDVWLWSWIIPISIEKNVQINKIYWLEKSSRAIEIALINAKKHNSKLEILTSDLLSVFLKENNFDFKGKQILITANLPYVKNWDWINMSEDTRFEPKMALFWWQKTGFELYKKFYKQVLQFKDKFKLNKIIVITEIGFDQRKVAKDFLNKNLINSKFFPDLSGIQRFIISEI